MAPFPFLAALESPHWHSGFFKGIFSSWGLGAKDTSRLQLYICQFDQQMGERAIKLWRLSPSPFNPARRAGVIPPPGALIGF